MANAQSQVGTSTQSGTNDWLNSLMGTQVKTIAETITPLIQGGLEMMGANPAMQNFSDATGKKFEFNQPQWLTDFAETARSWAPPQKLPEEQPQAQDTTPFYLRGVSPQQQARYQNWLAHQNKFGR